MLASFYISWDSAYDFLHCFTQAIKLRGPKVISSLKSINYNKN